MYFQSFRQFIETADAEVDNRTFQQVYQELLRVIQAAPDLARAIQQLQRAGVKSPDASQVESGSGGRTALADALYSYLAGADKPEINNPNIDRQLGELSQQIAGLGTARYVSEIDPSNPWHYFHIPTDGEKSNTKIYLKIPADQMASITSVAKLISNQPQWFRQFKFAYDSNDFLNRRDNMVMYLTKEGEANLNNAMQQVQSAAGVQADTGTDLTAPGATGKPESISSNQVLAARLTIAAAVKSPKVTADRRMFSKQGYNFVLHNDPEAQNLRGSTSPTPPTADPAVLPTPTPGTPDLPTDPYAAELERLATGPHPRDPNIKKRSRFKTGARAFGDFMAIMGQGGYQNTGAKQGGGGWGHLSNLSPALAS